MSTLITEAAGFARLAHGMQVRKYTGEPYWTHPERVAGILEATLAMPDSVIAAAWLHDVVEDTAVTIGEIANRFGTEVAIYVAEVTDVSRPEDGNRAARKRLDREHLERAGPYGQSIKLADLIDNTASITAHDPHFARTYMAEKAELLPRLAWGHPALRFEAERILRAWERAQLDERLGSVPCRPC